MLGLDAPAAPQSDAIPPATNALSMDSLREKSFSGLDSFYEPEKPKAGGRILLLVVLLAALGGAGWWTYRNYLNAAGPRTPENATATVADTPVEKPLTQPESKEDASPPQAAVPETVAGSPAGNTTAAPAPNGKSADEPAVAAPIAKIAPAVKRPAKREPTVASAKTSRPPEPPAADTGDAVFRKGEAYLYGRGVPENCDQAVKNLKAASAKSNAKARSAFGTMYATGHCVARDLPTSYLWFALALQVDPNNQILEKDLNAIWNQMTPPERQMATRMKQ